MPDGGTILIAGSEDLITHDVAGLGGSGRFICLSVADRGDGMDAEILARATEPFFTTKGVGKGTGLGLSMVHGFAEQSGGQLIIRSRKGDGTVAELWLPAAVDAVAPMQTDDAGTPDPIRQPAADASQLVVLTVDDDRLVLMNTTVVLNRLGHRVYSAPAGQQALEILRREAGINLVIVNHALPDMTGAELAEAIRTDWPSMPIIFATPLADASVQRISKPYREEELSNAIARILPAKMPIQR
jgi:CheY-like chemotaxis protein